MGKKPGLTKTQEEQKSTPRGTIVNTPVIIRVKDKDKLEAPVVHKTYKCQECNRPVPKNSHRLVCYTCAHEGEEKADLTDIQTRNQINKAMCRERRSTREALVVASAGVSEAERVQEALEVLGYA